MGVVEDLVRAREAFERREWVATYDGLSATNADDVVAEDFARLATAAYLLGRRNDCVQAMQRAYKAHGDAGETLAAVRCAFWLARVLLTGGEVAVGSGWLACGQRLLDDVSGDVVERGYLLIHVMFRHVFSGEFAEALVHAESITDYGRRFRDPDLLAMGLCGQGRMLLYLGRAPEGLGCFDEAMVGISAGDVSPIFAGEIYCTMIEGCQEISDVGRLTEWTRALTTWCETQPGLVPFTGQCAVHRGQIMRFRGAYDQAADEFDRAARRYLQGENKTPAGLALGERGEVFRIRGDVPAAEAAYAEAIGYGHEPQPGLALLWLARGRVGAAVGAIARLLAEPRNPVHRSQLLPGAIEILVAAGRIEQARPLVEELSGIAAGFGSAALTAMAAYARGCVSVADNQPARALGDLRRAMRGWSALGAPYEIARARVLIGRALRALADEDSARAELEAARRTFSDLGAEPARRAVEQLLMPTPTPGGLTTRELEVLRLVAAGRSNVEIAAALFLSEKTVARHLSNIFGKIDVSSRTAAAAYAYERGLL